MEKKTSKFLSLILLILNLTIYSHTLPAYKTKLKNGLTVIISENNTLPLVSVLVAYKAGSIHDPQGKEGIMYLLQNMMFNGSANVGKMEHFVFINQAGGELNAIVYRDRTFFYQTVPSNYLPLVLWLESDRMGFLKFSEYEFKELKNRVIEDINFRIENQPFLNSYFLFDKIAFGNSPYSHPVVGSPSSIRSITIEDIKERYNKYYSPSNAILIIVGDIERRKTINLIKKYFSSLPSRNLKFKNFTPVKFPGREITKTLKDPFVPLPVTHLGYFFPLSNFQDYYPLKLLEYVLLRGNSSRLIERLIQEQRLVFQVDGGLERKGENGVIFKIFIVNNSIMTMDRVLNIIFSEIENLKRKYISRNELTKAKNNLKADFYKKFSSTLEEAFFLANQEIENSSFNSIQEELQKYMKVTALDLMRVINRYFLPKNRIILKVVPK